MMDEQKLRSVYDCLCMALTEYENPDPADIEKGYDIGSGLYEQVVDQVNRLAELLN